MPKHTENTKLLNDYIKSLDKDNVKAYKIAVELLQTSFNIEKSIGLYNRMIKEGIAPEQARAVLPQGMMTEWIWSGSLYAFARVCNLRNKPDVQEETSR